MFENISIPSNSEQKNRNENKTKSNLLRINKARAPLAQLQ